MTFFEWYAQVLREKIMYRTLSTTQTLYTVRVCAMQRARVRAHLKWCKLFDLINTKRSKKKILGDAVFTTSL